MISRFRDYDSVVGHLGCDRTYKALKLKLSGHNWVGMKQELKNYIAECTICQKIKWQRPANWEDMVEHHLYTVIGIINRYSGPIAGRRIRNEVYNPYC